MTTIEGYETTTLENGFEVHTQKIPGAKKTYFEIRIKAGSDHEPLSLSGVAHYLEHMIGYGSDNYSEDDLLPYFIDQGGDFNYATGKDRTYYWRYAFNDKIPDYLERTADILTNPTFTQEHVDIERTPILDEHDGDQAKLLSKQINDLSSALHPNQKLSIPAIGQRHDIENMTLEQLKEFHEDFYVPSNMFLVAVGDVDHDYYHEMAQTYFGSMIDKPIPRTPNNKNFIPADHAVSKDYEVSAVSFGFQALPKDNPNQITEYFSSRILDRKIYDELRQERKLLYTAESFLDHYAGVSKYVVFSTVDPNKISETVNAFLDVIEECCTSIQDKDIQVLKNQEEETLADQLTNPKEIGQYMASSVQYRGRYVPLEEFDDVLNNLRKADIQKSIREMVSRDAYSLVLGPNAEATDFIARLSDLKEKLGLNNSRPSAGRDFGAINPS